MCARASICVFLHAHVCKCLCVCVMREREREADHWVTLFVNSTGLLAEMDLGSALPIVRVYISENLGNLEDTTNPVPKDPCQNGDIELLSNRNFLAISDAKKWTTRYVKL